MNLLETLFGKPAPSTNVRAVNETLATGPRPYILDVRQPEEFQGGHIAGAKLIPLNELSKRMNELPKNKEIICVCQSGNRSRSAAGMLTASGYKAINMTGGMFAWRQAGFPIRKGSGA